jgi:hypothetical protein
VIGHRRHLLIKRLDDEKQQTDGGAADRAQPQFVMAPPPSAAKVGVGISSGTGTLDERAQVFVMLLQRYLQPDNY